MAPMEARNHVLQTNDVMGSDVHLLKATPCTVCNLSELEQRAFQTRKGPQPGSSLPDRIIQGATWTGLGFSAVLDTSQAGPGFGTGLQRCTLNLCFTPPD